MFSANLLGGANGGSIDFHVQSEEFPALPGANHIGSTNGHLTVCVHFVLFSLYMSLFLSFCAFLKFFSSASFFK